MDTTEFPSFSGPSFNQAILKVNNFIYPNTPRDPPNLSEYDVIGFDADHCIVKYHLPALTRHMTAGAAHDFVKRFNYPPEFCDFNEEEFDFPLNGIVIDKERGVFLKLGENHQILRAYYGYEKLTREQIAELYGEECSWKEFDLKVVKNKDYQAMIGFFDSNLTILYSKAIELKKQGKINYTHREMWEHIRTHVYGNWANVNYAKKQINHIADFGTFFPALVKEPQKYIRKSPDFRQVLDKLKAKGVRIFLATNSHHQFTNLIMSNSIGEDWKDYFDLVCENCQKPGFFEEGKPFIKVDTTKPMFEGEEKKVLEKEDQYLYGNRKDLEAYFEKLTGKKELKYLFIGDNYNSDCRASAEADNWESIVVVEELQNKIEYGKKESLLQYQNNWGDYFEEITEKGKVRTIFIQYFEKHTRYGVPLVSWLNGLIK